MIFILTNVIYIVYDRTEERKSLALLITRYSLLGIQIPISIQYFSLSGCGHSVYNKQTNCYFYLHIKCRTGTTFIQANIT